MAKLFYFLAFVTLAVHAQENAVHNLSPSLRECYVNKYLSQRDNRLPHTLNTFLAILRKIENTEGLNMDLRSLSVALLHRFRQDGIVPNPLIPPQDGVSPYAPIGNQFYRHAHTLRFIQGNALLFPNNSITAIERCTLHFMMSSSIEIYERGDEGKVCKYANAYRYARDVGSDDDGNVKGANSDVETLSSDEIRTMTNKKDGDDQATLDPNSLYPEYPPNHPDFARLFSLPRSKCPVENGVIKTPWGVVSPGLVLAGIAAATQPQTFSLQDIQTNISDKTLDLSSLTMDTKWIVTLAGDLAEAALVQGPLGEKIHIGATGNWNSTALPRWYFLNANEKLEMTTAEIRGDLDGLILANEVKKWYSQVPSLRLSQIFDMYYSKQGFFDSSIRACDRRTLFTAVAPNDTMTRQAYIASLLMSSELVKATLAPEKIKNYAVQAVNELVTYVPTSMNKDLSCADTDKFYDFNPKSVDLTIILDTNWPFSMIQPILANLLENIDLNPYNSNFTLINGNNGVPIINSTSNILEFNAYNSSQYENITHGFDLPKSIDALYLRLMNLLDNERDRGVGGARSNVVLIIPYMSTISNTDKDYSLKQILRIREKAPDTTLLIMAYGSKDTWSALTQVPSTDMFSIVIGDTEEALTSITTVVSRIKQVPKRLINTQCGSNYATIGSSNSYVDYVSPNGTNFYRLHPNYFFRTQDFATIKIQSSNSNRLTVCSSRGPMYANSTVPSESCVSITSETHAISVNCADASMIHECPPLYISVTSNSTGVTYQCTDPRVCRYPYQIKYTVSYENLLCTSGTNTILNSLILIVLTIFVNLY
ncbi:uncharacterized protein LOC128878955 isoform X1 [Hylaeus volcanicus]|uniref:uncharacterized protein LOC128878955 isoform X1 n=1 Tax=Hylaeus volcanicus TaxID=313075 RepID=UPI0023B7F62C|nr:uncharacterized protein LOC128878955 isoform X1 [Hylaeus volcanicus]XP_053983621.1 uncharacterized protein LOC128878955 isoform X1 [Hylaeus volcanicus]